MSEGGSGSFNQKEITFSPVENKVSDDIVYDDSSELEAEENLRKLLSHEIAYRPEDFAHSKGVVHKRIVGRSGQGVFSLNLFQGGGFEIFPGNRREKYWFDVNLGRDNVMNLSAKLVGSDNSRTPRMPRLTELTTLSLDYFESKGVSVNGIKGVWGRTVGPDEDLVANTNFTMFKDGLEKGMSSEEAALHTPTGRAATKNGYNTPDSVLDNDDSVSVIFRKSRPTSSRKISALTFLQKTFRRSQDKA